MIGTQTPSAKWELTLVQAKLEESEIPTASSHRSVRSLKKPVLGIGKRSPLSPNYKRAGEPKEREIRDSGDTFKSVSHL